MEQWKADEAAAKYNYYYQFAIVEQITTIIIAQRQAKKAAQEAVDAARLRGDLSTRDKIDLDNEIEERKSFVNALGEPD